MKIYNFGDLAKLCKIIRITFLVLAFVFLVLELSFFAFFEDINVQPKLENNIRLSSTYEQTKGDVSIIINNTNNYNQSRLQDDYSILFNMTNFKFLTNNQNICRDDGDQLFMIIFVHSALMNAHKRDTIRRTWGNVNGVLKFFAKTHNKIRLVFLIGTTYNDTNLLEAVHKESKIHHDLIQGNFIDSYRNMTYKVMLKTFAVVLVITYHIRIAARHGPQVGDLLLPQCSLRFQGRR